MNHTKIFIAKKILNLLSEVLDTHFHESLEINSVVNNEKYSEKDYALQNEKSLNLKSELKILTHLMASKEHFEFSTKEVIDDFVDNWMNELINEMNSKSIDIKESSEVLSSITIWLNSFSK